MGPDEAWKEAHAQAWDSAGRVQRLGKRAWPERRRPAVAATWTRSVVCTLQHFCSSCVPCSFAVPGCVVPSGPVPRLLVAWTTASDRLKKDPGRDPQHDRGRHWPAVEATGAPSPGNNKPALYYRATEALAMTTCTCAHTHRWENSYLQSLPCFILSILVLFFPISSINLETSSLSSSTTSACDTRLVFA